MDKGKKPSETDVFIFLSISAEPLGTRTQQNPFTFSTHTHTHTLPCSASSVLQADTNQALLQRISFKKDVYLGYIVQMCFFSDAENYTTG